MPTTITGKIYCIKSGDLPNKKLWVNHREPIRPYAWTQNAPQAVSWAKVRQLRVFLRDTGEPQRLHRVGGGCRVCDNVWVVTQGRAVHSERPELHQQERCWKVEERVLLGQEGEASTVLLEKQGTQARVPYCLQCQQQGCYTREAEREVLLWVRG